MVNLVEEIVDDCKSLLKYKHTRLFLTLLPLLIVLFVVNMMQTVNNFTPAVGIYDVNESQNASLLLNNFYKDFPITTYYQNISCINAVVIGKNDVCIILPEKESNIQELQIYLTLDNFEKIKPYLQTYTLSLGSQGDDSKTEITVNLLTKMGAIKDELANQTTNINNMNSELTALDSKITQLKEETEKLDIKFSVTDFSADEMNKQSNNALSNLNTLKKKGKKAVETATTSLSDIKTKVVSLNLSQANEDAIIKIINSSTGDLSSLDGEIDQNYNDANTDLSSLLNTTTALKANVQNLNTQIIAAMQSKQTMANDLNSVKASINVTQDAVAVIESYFNEINAALPSVKSNTNGVNGLVATQFNQIAANKIAYHLMIIFAFITIFLTLLVASLLTKIKLAEGDNTYFGIFGNVFATTFVINIALAIVLTILYSALINFNFIFLFHIYFVVLFIFTLLFTLIASVIAVLTHTEETNAMAIFSILTLFVLFSELVFKGYNVYTQFNPFQLFIATTTNSLLLIEPIISFNVMIAMVYIIFFFGIVWLLSGSKYILKHPQVSFSHQVEHHHHKQNNEEGTKAVGDEDVVSELERIGAEDEKEHHYAKTEDMSIEDYHKAKKIASKQKEIEEKEEEEKEKKVERVQLQEEKQTKRVKSKADDIVENLAIEGELQELLKKNKKLTKKELRQKLCESHDEDTVDDVLTEYFK